MGINPPFQAKSKIPCTPLYTPVQCTVVFTQINQWNHNVDCGYQMKYSQRPDTIVIGHKGVCKVFLPASIIPLSSNPTQHITPQYNKDGQILTNLSFFFGIIISSQINIYFYIFSVCWGTQALPQPFLML